MGHLLRCAACAMILLTTASSVSCAEPRVATPVETRTVSEILAAYAAAFNARDAAKVADLWTPDGQVVDLRGNKTVGRAEIRKMYDDLFTQQPQAKLAITTLEVHPMESGALRAEVLPKIEPPAPGAPAEIQSSLLLVKDDGRWRIDSARDSLRAAASFEPLKALSWLVGEWSTTSKAPDKPSVFFSCQWTGSKSFLTRLYSVRGNNVSHQGAEVIGYDPRTKTIRSWVFDSDGGFTERTWKPDGGLWIISAQGVAPDGRQVSATEVIRRDGDNKLFFRSENIRVEGDRMPDLDWIEMQRRVAEEAKTPAVSPEPPVLPKPGN